jgi:sulfur-oxidizing protein SoxY
MSAALPRRALLAAGLLGLALRPARATRAELQAAIEAFAADTPPQRGRIALEIAPLVENGNAVPLTVTVESPMTAAQHVREIAVYTELNPQHEVLRCQLGPRNGRAQVATRIRLATSQQLVALARLSDGSVWMQDMDVIVTLAACVEGG